MLVELIEQELSWERQMVDRGIDRYMLNVERARTKINKAGKRVSIKDESNTSYGISMLKRFVGDLKTVVEKRTQAGLSGAGRNPVGYTYIAACEYAEVSYIAAKCIVDSISRNETLTSLASRIGQRVEDQMRFATFQEHHPKYFKAVLSDMKRRKVSDYRHKRQVLVHISNKAAGNPEIYQEAGKPVLPRWIDWSAEAKAHVGVALIDCFIAATSDYDCDCEKCFKADHRIKGSGMVEKVNVRTTGKRSTNYIIGTDKAAVWIKANMAVAALLQPDFMPTLVPPKPWTTPTDGGFYTKELRRRKPLVKTSPKHLKMLRTAHMPEVYAGVNAAQETPWQVNRFVYEQAMQEWRADCGIGMPGNLKIEPAPCPLETIEQEDMSDSAFKLYKKMVRKSLTPVEKARYAEWSDAARESYTKEVERVSKVLGLSRVLGVARQLLDYDEFYFVHTLDYRGRMYSCGAGLTPQGPDLSKGLLKFRRKTKLMDNGYWHLCIHAAGVFGKDDGSLEDRVAWVHENKTAILRTGLDPSDTRDFWKAADKPYMFLAACEELAQIWAMHPMTGNNCYQQDDYKGYAYGYLSNAVTAQDGKCNGIQHFSAMLLDQGGAAYVNLAANKVMQDIYQIAADKVAEMLQETIKNGGKLGYFEGNFWDGSPSSYVRMAQDWLDFIFTRKGAKKSTMIIPYGGSKRSCLKAVSDYIKDHAKELIEEDSAYVVPFGDAADGDLRGTKNAGIFMHHYLWKALDEVVVAARKAMGFLRDIAVTQARHNNAIEWTTPTGFMARQEIMSTKESEIQTILSGRIHLYLQIETDKVNRLRMSQAMPPNFVHSMDAAHLIKTVNTAGRIGIRDFALVHDSFGVPAGQCEAFHKVIRSEFVKIYKEDWLVHLLDEQMELYPELAKEFPGTDSITRGTFEINEVLNSPHFFR